VRAESRMDEVLVVSSSLIVWSRDMLCMVLRSFAHVEVAIIFTVKLGPNTTRIHVDMSYSFLAHPKKSLFY
jgi:hypothetical protein